MGKEIKKNSFEESINRLEELVDKMESGESSLEQNLEWFEEGMDQECGPWFDDISLLRSTNVVA